jgi:hypothetical protein
VPVAAVGETVAVNVTVASSSGVAVDAPSVVVVEIFDQNPPHPGISTIAASKEVMKAVLIQLILLRIQSSPFPSMSNKRVTRARACGRFVQTNCGGACVFRVIAMFLDL